MDRTVLALVGLISIGCADGGAPGAQDASAPDGGARLDAAVVGSTERDASAPRPSKPHEGGVRDAAPPTAPPPVSRHDAAPSPPLVDSGPSPSEPSALPAEAGLRAPPQDAGQVQDAATVSLPEAQETPQALEVSILAEVPAGASTEFTVIAQYWDGRREDVTLASDVWVGDDSTGYPEAGRIHGVDIGRTSLWADFGGAKGNTTIEVVTPNRVRQLSPGNGWTCGHAEDLTISCWGPKGTLPLAGQGMRYQRMVMGGEFVCGESSLSVDGESDGLNACWWRDGSDMADTHPEARDISAGPDWACGLAGGGKVACWGQVPIDPELLTSDGAVTVGTRHACRGAIAATMQCVGEAVDEPPRGIPEAFDQVVAGDDVTCGLSRPYGIFCWGSFAEYMSQESVTGFTRISVGRAHLCASMGDSAGCGGINPLINPHPVTTADVRGERACGVRRSDGLGVCWGDRGTTN